MDPVQIELASKSMPPMNWVKVTSQAFTEPENLNFSARKERNWQQQDHFISLIGHNLSG